VGFAVAGLHLRSEFNTSMPDEPPKYGSNTKDMIVHQVAAHASGISENNEEHIYESSQP
jgi:hypothetical protein